MYALPGQLPEQALQDVRTALAFAPQHLSVYHLTLEPNTLFHRNPPALPDDDDSGEMQQRIEELLAANGYRHYETSAFALPGRRSRHNLNYWMFGDYLGIGAGAHSKLSFPDKVIRQMRHKQPQTYLRQVAGGAPLQSENAVGPAELKFEFMMNALRLNEGFDSDLFQQRTSLPLLGIRRELAEAEKRGLLVRTLRPEGAQPSAAEAAGRSALHSHIAPTQMGQRFLNDLLGIFLPR